jgi:hypothetical protein
MKKKTKSIRIDGKDMEIKDSKFDFKQISGLFCSLTLNFQENGEYKIDTIEKSKIGV